MSDIETKLGQIATVINQIDDPKVPRNIRKGAKEACEQWLLNKSKENGVEKVWVTRKYPLLVFLWPAVIPLTLIGGPMAFIMPILGL